MNINYFLPGTDQQLRFLGDHIELQDKSVLVIGSNSEEIALNMAQDGASSVVIILDDYESLLKTRLQITGNDKLSVKLMDFENTDFHDAAFDLIYAQASISLTNRNKIVKEIKRIIKPGGLVCLGEIVSLTENPPVFIKHIWESSSILPLLHLKAGEYYTERKFEIILQKDLSYTLRDFYKSSKNMLREKSAQLTEQERSYYKKILKKISHESNAYLNLGGENYIGFMMLILRKAAE